MDADRVVYYRDLVKRQTANSEFDLAGVTTLPRVDVMHGLPGRDGDLIRAAVDAGAKGIVIAAAGAGATSGAGRGLEYARQKGVFVVTARGRAAADRGADGRRQPARRRAARLRRERRRRRRPQRRRAVTRGSIAPRT